MSITSPNRLMTAEEFLALPDDPLVERMLIKGELWEQEMTNRNRRRSATESMIVYQLVHWLRTQPEPRGVVASGEAGCWLRRSPDSVVGIDVAYFAADVAQVEGASTTMWDGPPVLAVEILSPSSLQELVEAKIRDYLDSGVQLVWIVDPGFKTVTVYSRQHGPQMFAGKAVITGESHLPGFALPVSELFQI